MPSQYCFQGGLGLVCLHFSIALQHIRPRERNNPLSTLSSSPSHLDLF
jgi:hypothetical protein